ncbi:MAG: succinate dehydrogenase/fumarate reductase iron-sulfur subunit [Candidatus Omnitrophota bacterium]|nr:succinate dehydrogenase/fumarate reductase iron-sulfur subunit [Candidatus Omnitrophota bacterium]
MNKIINLTLKVWRQKNAQSQGRFETYKAEGIDTAMSFLEMLDVVNERLTKEGREPIAFDHDCREGICGACGAVINGRPHGPLKGTTLCQLHMRHFKDGQTLVIEPWRAGGFPVLKDLAVDRSAFDRVMQAGGFISVKTGQACDTNAVAVPKDKADTAMDTAECIGCGACVAACPNASAMLFVAAKVVHLNILPQGEVEKDRRALNMVKQMDAEGFGNCSNAYQCEAACPKEISVEHIARLNKYHRQATRQD